MLGNVDSSLAARLTEICGADSVVTDPQELRTYECDGLTAHRCSPGIVVLPQSADQVAAIVCECAARRIPFVARGSGTGLSGGALPRADGVLIVTAKMRSIIAIDPASRRAIVEPGVTICRPVTWWTVKPCLRQWAPPEFSATIPPTEQITWLDGSGA